MLPKLPAQGLFPTEKAPSHLMWYLHVVSGRGGGGGKIHVGCEQRCIAVSMTE